MIRAALVSLGAAAVLAGAAVAAPRTTEPAAITQVKVSVTDKGVAIAKDKFTKGKLTRYPRGAIIDFVIQNKGSKPYQAELLLAGKHDFSKYESATTSVRTKPVKPGTIAHLKINFYFRSKFLLQSLLKGKTQASAPITIF
jgi:hypothetical protein